MEQIRKVGEGAYFVPSFSDQMVLYNVPGITTQLLVCTYREVGDEKPIQDIDPLKNELPDYNREARERIYRGLQQVGFVDHGSFRNDIEICVDSF